MNLFFQIILFVIVLLFYIHITNQYKKGEDMEIYELDYKDNDYLQEVINQLEFFKVSKFVYFLKPFQSIWSNNSKKNIFFPKIF